MPARPKKPYKSHASRGKSRGLGKAAPPSISSKMGKKKGGRGRKGNNRGKSGKSIRLVST